jgi:hypothetical protein
MEAGRSLVIGNDLLASCSARDAPQEAVLFRHMVLLSRNASGFATVFSQRFDLATAQVHQSDTLAIGKIAPYALLWYYSPCGARSKDHEVEWQIVALHFQALTGMGGLQTQERNRRS